jgi:hypothetical protein
VYLNPIERYIWNVINMIPKIDWIKYDNTTHTI